MQAHEMNGNKRNIKKNRQEGGFPNGSNGLDYSFGA
jgi:hypothetical protein